MPEANENEWYYIINGDRFGPSSFVELQQFAVNGHLSPDDLVWKIGLTDWMPAKKVLVFGFQKTKQDDIVEPPPILVAQNLKSKPPIIISKPPIIPTGFNKPNQRESTGDHQKQRNKPDQVSFNWDEWNSGGKAIVISGFIATASMLLPWVDIGFVSSNAFNQGTFLFLLVFLYPIQVVLKQIPMNSTGGQLCVGIGFVGTLFFIQSKGGDFLGRSFNATGLGAWVFIVALIILEIGIVNYEVDKNKGSSD